MDPGSPENWKHCLLLYCTFWSLKYCFTSNHKRRMVRGHSSQHLSIAAVSGTSCSTAILDTERRVISSWECGRTKQAHHVFYWQHDTMPQRNTWSIEWSISVRCADLKTFIGGSSGVGVAPSDGPRGVGVAPSDGSSGAEKRPSEVY